MIKVHLGIDDVDTPYGGCTTHFTAKLLAKWIKYRQIQLIDYPNLVRLAPGVPWKTRGNGSLVLRMTVPSIDYALDLFEEAINEGYEYVARYHHPESQPVLAMYIGEPDDRIKWLGHKAVNDVVPTSLVKRIIEKSNGRIYFKKLSQGMRGLIGALAGIGFRMTSTDYTFELIAYRDESYLGTPRRVDPESVKEMDEATRPNTLLNYDYETNKPLITPHGPDPVLLGIRGEEPDILVKAYNYLKIDEPVPLRMIYRTNQHTDAHLVETTISKAYIYRGVIIRGFVDSVPRRIRGGHVIFKLRDFTGRIDVAAYEPTGGFRQIVEQLWIGDEVEVYGVVRPYSSRHGPTINLEKIRVIMVKPIIKQVNPRCPRCGARMKSVGRGKGFKCPKCGYRDPSAHKITYYLPRKLRPGFYEPPPRAFKHLMKPIVRMGREKKGFPEVFIPSRFIWVYDKILK